MEGPETGGSCVTNEDGDHIASLFVSVREALDEEAAQKRSLHQKISNARHLADATAKDGHSMPAVAAGAGRNAAFEGDTADVYFGNNVSFGERGSACEADQALLKAVMGSATGGEQRGHCHARILQGAIQRNADETLGFLKDRRRQAGLARQVRLSHMAARRAVFAHSTEWRLAQARAQGLMTTRRLMMQGTDATRRLQELLHECVGEYEKARLRGARRRRLSAEACDHILTGKILDLRWSRFCSRLEADAFGLVEAKDLGDPAANPARRRTPAHGRADASPAAAVAKGAAATRASCLAPVLARAGLPDSRILRVVAFCPRGGGGGDNDTSGGAGRFVGKVAVPRGVQRGETAYRDRRLANRGSVIDAVAGGVAEALRDDGGGDDGGAAVVLLADNSPLGVADVLRKAVLRTNHAVGAVLASCTSDASTVDADRGAAADRGLRGRHVMRSDVGKGCRGGVTMSTRSSVLSRLGQDAGGAGRSSGKVGERGEGDERGEEGDGGDVPGESIRGYDARCTVVGAEPGLLLSSSHLLWTLQHPFSGTDGAHLVRGVRGKGKAEGCKRSRVGGLGDDSGKSTTASGPRTDGKAATPQARIDRAGWDLGAWTNVPSDRACSRREGLSRDVASLGAAPVGSRLYYCLEEAGWEASQDRAVRRGRRSETRVSTGVGERDRTRREGSSRSTEGQAAAGSGNRGDTEGVDALAEGGAHRRRPRTKDGVGDADSSEVVAAMVFARSVSEMIAGAYVSKGCNGGEKILSEISAVGGGGTGSAWPSLVVDGGGAVGTPGGAASFLVTETADTHRSCSLLRPRHTDGVDDQGEKQRFDVAAAAAAAVPDVLVADVGPTNPEENHKSGSRPGEMSPNVAGTHGRHSNVGDGRQSPVGGRDGSITARKESKKHDGESYALHFAPAGVLQLLGTPHCREFLEALPPSARERLCSLYGGDGVRPPPVGHLYVPLAPLATSPAAAGAGADSVAASSAAITIGDDGGGDPTESTRRPSTTPLLGALLHPLPSRAMRELLQVYVATTRAAGATESIGGVRRTSGLFARPPTPGVRTNPCNPGSGGEGRGRKKGGDAAARCHRRVGDDVGPVGEGEAGPVKSFCNPFVGDLGEGGCYEEHGTSGGNGLRVIVGDLVATTPPSAVDILPDAPSLGYGDGDHVSGGIEASASQVTDADVGSVAVGGADDGNNPTAFEKSDGGGGGDGSGIDTHAGSRSSVSSAGIPVGGEPHNGTRAGKRQPAPGTAALNAVAVDNTLIVSSLRSSFRRAYVAVLAPVSVTPVSNGSSRAVLASRSRDPFLGASALLLQIETPRAQSLAHRCLVRGMGCSSGEATGVGFDGAESGEEVVPAVCRWRGCVANVLTGSLCVVHSQLKEFLDLKAAKAGCASEAFRFLPPGSSPKRRSTRKRRNSTARSVATALAAAAVIAGGGSGEDCVDYNRSGEGELAAARSMSPLLSELFNGKLAATIQMFCERAAAEARALRRGRRRGDGKHGGGDKEGRAHSRAPDKVPEWARWADPVEAETADRTLEADMRWAEQVLRAEKEVTSELRRLSALGVYPEAELAQVRRQHGGLATEWRQVVGGRGYETGVEGEEEEEEESVSAVADFIEKPAPANGYTTPFPPGGATRHVLPPTGGAGAGAGMDTAVITPGSSIASGALVGSAEKAFGRRRRRKSGGGSTAAVSAGGKGAPQTREDVRGRQEGGKEEVGGRESAVGEQKVRREEEIELEFTRLKKALFRRRRQEAEHSKISSRGHPFELSVPWSSPLAADELSSASLPGASSREGFSSHGRGRNALGGAGIGRSATALSATSDASFPTPPADRQVLSPVSTLLARARRKQAPQQQQLLPHNGELPRSHSSTSSQARDSRSHHAAQPPSNPENDDRSLPAHNHRTSLTTTTATTGATVAVSRKTYPRWQSFPVTTVVSAGMSTPAMAGPGGRTSSRVSFNNPVSWQGQEQRGKYGGGKTSGRGGSSARSVPRRRASAGIVDGGGGVGLPASKGAGKGFNATPYRTTVLFRDR